jgi:hypothetical protein
LHGVRRLSIAALAIAGSLGAGRAAGQPALVQFNDSTNQNPSIVVTLAQPVTPGDLIVVGLGYNGPSASVSDSAGDSYQSAVNLMGTSGPIAGWGCAVFYAGVMDAGTAPFSVTIASPGQASAPLVAEYSGIDLSAPLDSAAGSMSPTASSQLDSGVISTTVPGDLLLGWACTSGVPTPGGGFAEVAQFGSQLLEQATAPVPANYMATAGVAATEWFMEGAAFRASVPDAGSALADAGADAGQLRSGVPGGPLDLVVTTSCSELPTRASGWGALFAVCLGLALWRRRFRTGKDDL